MHRRQFEAHLDKVFDFSARVSALPEGRQSPRHAWQKVFDSVFLGRAIQIPNLRRLEAECRQGVLRQRIGNLSEDAMGYALQRQDPASIFALRCEVARRLKRNGVLGSSWARGRMVAAVDGIEICSSFVRCCDTCMKRTVQHQVDGERREDTQYYHRVVAVVLVSTDFPVPLGIRFRKDGETEVPGAVRLLHDLDRQLGRRFLDVLVAGARYLQRGFVKEVENLDLEWVITLKENQPDLLSARKCVARRAKSAPIIDPMGKVEGDDSSSLPPPVRHVPYARSASKGEGHGALASKPKNACNNMHGFITKRKGGARACGSGWWRSIASRAWWD